MILLKQLYNEIVNESPIGTITHYGDFNSDDLSFDDPLDRKLVTDPKHIERIKNFFKNCPVLFNLYFINIDPKNQLISGTRDNLYGEIDISELNSSLKLNINPDKNAISIFYTGNWGNDKVALTPWILAHRISHALFKRQYSIFDKHQYRQLLVDFSDCYEYCYYRGYSDADEYLSLSEFLKYYFSYIFTFNSAKLQKLDRTGEVIHELFAQFILNGHIKINNTPQEVKINFKILKLNSEVESIINEKLANFKIHYETHIKENLEHEKGKCFIL